MPTGVTSIACILSCVTRWWMRPAGNYRDAPAPPLFPLISACCVSLLLFMLVFRWAFPSFSSVRGLRTQTGKPIGQHRRVEAQRVFCRTAAALVKGAVDGSRGGDRPYISAYWGWGWGPFPATRFFSLARYCDRNIVGGCGIGDF